jgi:hypothetical protein
VSAMASEQSAYELLRLRNVAINTQKLQSLGISKPFTTAAPQLQPKRIKKQVKDVRPLRESLRVRSLPSPA